MQSKGKDWWLDKAQKNLLFESYTKGQTGHFEVAVAAFLSLQLQAKSDSTVLPPLDPGTGGWFPNEQHSGLFSSRSRSSSKARRKDGVAWQAACMAVCVHVFVYMHTIYFSVVNQTLALEEVERLP
ncbi:hypothetical protein CB1_001496004 [Camelus ferus]|nr:hypothetical protein CB1_001496004 [Camelus ferus]